MASFVNQTPALITVVAGGMLTRFVPGVKSDDLPEEISKVAEKVNGLVPSEFVAEDQIDAAAAPAKTAKGAKR